MKKHYMGIDPDKSGSAIALLSYDAESRVIHTPMLGILEGAKQGSMDMTCFLQACNLKHALDQCLYTTGSDRVSVFIEGQSMDMARSKGARYKDIKNLAQIAGVMFGVISIALPDKVIECKEPSYWKQQVPKPVQQGRTLSTLGWAFELTKEYARPSMCAKMMSDLHTTLMIGMEKTATTPWKHVLDAVGMALFLLKKDNPKHFL